jgi:hypothetical protein
MMATANVAHCFVNTYRILAKNKINTRKYFWRGGGVQRNKIPPSEPLSKTACELPPKCKLYPHILQMLQGLPIYLKVKLSLCFLTEHHAMKVYWGVEV